MVQKTYQQSAGANATGQSKGLVNKMRESAAQQWLKRAADFLKQPSGLAEAAECKLTRADDLGLAAAGIAAGIALLALQGENPTYSTAFAFALLAARCAWDTFAKVANGGESVNENETR